MPAPVEAEVRLHGKRVGTLRYDRGGAEFRYEDDLASPDHKVLGQVFEDDPHAIRRTHVDVPAWFANLLPEGALRQQVIRELGGGNVGDYTLLLRLGRQLPGAVTVHSEAEPLDDLALADNTGPEMDTHLRFSLAGVQLKYSVASQRLTFPGRDANNWWIVKLPDRHLPDITANEYVTMRWLSAAGFDVPHIGIVMASAVQGIPEGVVQPDQPVYLIERFDRSGEGRVHVEDFAQVADVAPMFKYTESQASYDTLGAVILRLAGESGYHDYVRRLVAMLIIGNTDAHLKNWALIYRDGRTPSLAPVYDVHSLTVYSTYRYALSLNAEKVPSAIGLDDFRRMAENIDADPELTAAAAVAAAQQLRESWNTSARAEAKRHFEALANHYTQRLDTLPICTAV